jgi:hypothetical protein
LISGNSPLKIQILHHRRVIIHYHDHIGVFVLIRQQTLIALLLLDGRLNARVLWGLSL